MQEKNQKNYRRKILIVGKARGASSRRRGFCESRRPDHFLRTFGFADTRIMSGVPQRQENARACLLSNSAGENFALAFS